MNKFSLIVTCALLCVTDCSSAEFFIPRSPMIFGGTIQFPRSVTKVPDIRIYRSGSIIDAAIDNTSKKISYSISDDRSQNMFTLLIAESKALSAEVDENTIKYWKVKPRHPYKFYSLMLKEVVANNQSTSSRTQAQQSPFIWAVKEHTLTFNNGRIPDNTIMVCYNPDFIDTISGGSIVNVPSIVIKPDILRMVGSEVILHEKSVEMLLSSALDYDSLHSHVKQTVKLDYPNKTVVTLTT